MFYFIFSWRLDKLYFVTVKLLFGNSMYVSIIFIMAVEFLITFDEHNEIAHSVFATSKNDQLK